MAASGGQGRRRRRRPHGGVLLFLLGGATTVLVPPSGTIMMTMAEELLDEVEEEEESYHQFPSDLLLPPPMVMEGEESEPEESTVEAENASFKEEEDVQFEEEEEVEDPLFHSNPSIRGCFYNKLEGWDKMRVCNSQDDPIDSSLCSRHDWNNDYYYPEIRIYTANWESSIMITWLLQIVLSEIAGVPTTMETGDPNVQSSLYDPEGGPFQYSDYYDGSFETFRQASVVHGDCTTSQARNHHNLNNNGTYVPCFHVMPEVWEGENKEVTDLVYEGIVEAPDAIGYLGQETWFVTAFTAKEYPWVLSYRYMMGEEKRHQLANIFKRPTTWKEYCQLVSPTNCTTPDATAQRPPRTPEEENRMFVEGLYTGYFRNTEKNDCIANPTTCTGHFADYPNGWSSYFVPITHHFNIALESDGSEPGSNGYPYETLMEIWRAANATKSHAMIQWSSPEWIYQEFLGTEAAFTVVELPTPTQECLDNRIGIMDRQSDNFTTRAGSPLGACGNLPYFPLHKVVSTSLRQLIFDPRIPEAVRSPGLSVLDVFYISKIRLDEMFTKLTQPQFEDQPREAICEWAVENHEFLQSFVPRSYPRTLQDKQGGKPLFYVSLAIGGLAFVSVLATGVSLYCKRDRRSVKIAQINFLWILLAGALVVAIGAIVIASPPTTPSCIAQTWLIMLGYTLMLVPLIIKVWAINQLMIASKKLRRFQIKIRLLFVVVTVVLVLVACYVALWTGLDPPTPQPEYELTDVVREDTGETVVLVHYHCSSNSMAWNIVGACWNALLLLLATFLAYQMRSVIQDTGHKNMSEAKTLAFLIYSHFWFTILRLLTYLMSRSVDSWTLEKIQSILFSVDTIVSIFIYFQPKLVGRDASKFTSSVTSTTVTTLRDCEVAGLQAMRNEVQQQEWNKNINRPPQQQPENLDDYPCNTTSADVQGGSKSPSAAAASDDEDENDAYDDYVEELKKLLEVKDMEISILNEEIALLNKFQGRLTFFKTSSHHKRLDIGDEIPAISCHSKASWFSKDDADEEEATRGATTTGDDRAQIMRMFGGSLRSVRSYFRNDEQQQQSPDLDDDDDDDVHTVDSRRASIGS